MTVAVTAYLFMTFVGPQFPLPLLGNQPVTSQTIHTLSRLFLNLLIYPCFNFRP